MKINNQKIVNRWNSVMHEIGCEHITIADHLSELEDNKEYYGITNGISINWMRKQAKYWLSCYYEHGNVRCDDRFRGKDEYRFWLAESGRLKRLVNKLESMENTMVVEWETEGTI